MISRPPSPRVPWSPAFAGPLLAAVAAAQGPQPVRVAVVAAPEIRQHERVLGSLRAAREAELAALEEGALVELLVREAAVVAQGDVLARTDARRLEVQQREAAAELEQARAEEGQWQSELDDAQADVEALATAAADRAVSQRELRVARTRVAVIEARLAGVASRMAAVQHRQELLEVRLRDTTLRAPFDGVVTARHAEPGEWLRPGDPVVTLVSRGVIEAWLDVPERLLGAARGVAPGLQLGLDATGGEAAALRARVVPAVHPRARTFPLIVDLDDRDGALVPGMAVSAWLPAGPAAPRLVVPRDALVRRPGQVTVFAVEGEGEGAQRARMVPVEVLFPTPQGTAIRPGGPLEAGASVVVEGNERLVDGTPVVIAAGAEGPANGGSGR